MDKFYSTVSFVIFIATLIILLKLEYYHFAVLTVTALVAIVYHLSATEDISNNTKRLVLLILFETIILYPLVNPSNSYINSPTVFESLVYALASLALVVQLYDLIKLLVQNIKVSKLPSNTGR